MAIAFDTAVDAGNATATSLTWSHTCTGSNRLLVVDVVGNTSSDVITGVTYNSVAMTLVAKVSSAAGGSARWIYQYLLENPASGANSVVVSASTSIFIAGHSLSYTGAAQSGQPNAFNTGVAASATSLTVAVTSTVDNCWLVGNLKNDAGAGSAGTGTTIREATATGGMTSCDRGPVTPAGSSSLQVTQSSTLWSGIVSAIAPPAPASAGNMFQMF